MSLATVNSVAQRELSGVANVLRFNWHFYVSAVLLAAATVSLLVIVPMPVWCMALGWCLLVTVLWLTLSSIIASYWVYDVAGILRLSWLPTLIHEPPVHCVNIHAGFDSSSMWLTTHWPLTRVTNLNIYNRSQMTEASIHRAQSTFNETASVESHELPLGDESCDLVTLIMSAHELRKQHDRTALFVEVDRILRPGGTLVIVEHLRDWRNFLAYGPGFCHFLPRSEWRRLANLGQLTTTRILGVTPFVAVFVSRRHEHTKGRTP